VLFDEGKGIMEVQSDIIIGVVAYKTVRTRQNYAVEMTDNNYT